MTDDQNYKESSLRSANLRRINQIWEMTQSVIAIMVTGSTLYAGLSLTTKGEGAAFALMSNAFFLVIGFYFGRTNPSRIRELQQGDKG